MVRLLCECAVCCVLCWHSVVCCALCLCVCAQSVVHADKCPTELVPCFSIQLSLLTHTSLTISWVDCYSGYTGGGGGGGGGG